MHVIPYAPKVQEADHYTEMHESYLDYMQVVSQYLQASLALSTEKLSHEPDAPTIVAAEAELEEAYQALMTAGGKIDFGLSRMLDDTHGVRINIVMTALRRVNP